MIQLTREQYSKTRHWFLPEIPGPLVGSHVRLTGNGEIYADRWPDPLALFAVTGGNYLLLGDPEKLSTEDLSGITTGFIRANPTFLPLLENAYPDLATWPRIILEQTQYPAATLDMGLNIRSLLPGDAAAIRNMSPEVQWISNTWGGPAGLADSGYAWGAFNGESLVSIACSFFPGEVFEDIGIVTEPAYRGKGFASACTSALIQDIISRGHQPC
jgi:hypothetical protein